MGESDGQGRELGRGYVDWVPHNRALGVELSSMRDGKVTLRLPYDPRFIGNPLTGVLHGGVITTMMDACCGVAVFLALPEPNSIATLDLRIDYMKPAEPERDVFGQAECYKLTKNVAFARGIAYQDDPAHPIAAVAAAFMLSTPRGDDAAARPAAGGHGAEADRGVEGADRG